MFTITEKAAIMVKEILEKQQCSSSIRIISQPG